MVMGVMLGFMVMSALMLTLMKVVTQVMRMMLMI